LAALTITDAALLPGSGAVLVRGTAGVAITSAGKSLYLDAATGTIKLADNNASALTADAKGVSAHAALPGQPITYYTGGNVAFGAILTVGETYYVGPGAGEIIPSGDLATGMYVKRLGQATTTSNMLMDLSTTDLVLHA
jgi:hypothetical protein